MLHAQRWFGVVVVGLALLAPPAWAQDENSGARCDAEAGNPLDPATPAGTGVAFGAVDAEAAITACTAAVAADAEDARRRYQLGRAYDVAEQFDQALIHYGAAADQGYGMALNGLGALYDGGYGVAEDPVEAARLYQQAADGGLVVAMENLGKLYEDGRGVAQDYAAALRLYEQAAETGSPYAFGAIGWLHENGFGVPQDDTEAVRLYRIAADGGEAFAQNNMGVMYAEGRGGLPESNVQAVKYYTMAADQGWALAALNVAWHYSTGEGVERDTAKAEQYLQQAVADGDAEVQGDARNDLAWLYATEDRRLDEAETLARAAVAAEPEDANRIDTLAWVLHRAGRNKEAYKLAEQAVALDGSNAAFAEHLATITTALGK